MSSETRQQAAIYILSYTRMLENTLLRSPNMGDKIDTTTIYKTFHA